MLQPEAETAHCCRLWNCSCALCTADLSSLGILQQVFPQAAVIKPHPLYTAALLSENCQGVSCGVLLQTAHLYAAVLTDAGSLSLPALSLVLDGNMPSSSAQQTNQSGKADCVSAQ